MPKREEGANPPKIQNGFFAAWLFPQGRVKGGDEPPSRRPLGLVGGDEGEWPALRKILPFEEPYQHQLTLLSLLRQH